MAVDYNAGLWCIAKHILSARVNLYETLEKLTRDCTDRVCRISPTTTLSAEEALAQLIEVERHASEVCSKCGDNTELARSMMSLADKAREIRQKLAQTYLPVRLDGEKDLPADVVDAVRSAYQEVDRLKTEIDRYATSMKQEQTEECERCVVDFGGRQSKLTWKGDI